MYKGRKRVKIPLPKAKKVRSLAREKSREQINRLIKRDEAVCRTCGSTKDLTVDHVIPLARGGSISIDNLQILCRKCNQKKGAK